jgi:AbrB family looped-hinge helix DNA binding protein
MTSKGQVTVPQAIREALGLEAGSKLVFELDEEGQVLVAPLRHQLEGLWELGDARRAPGQVMTLEAMNEAKRRGAAGLRKPNRKPAQ